MVKTNKNFESKVADPTKLLLDIKRLYSTIVNKILLWEYKFYCENRYLRARLRKIFESFAWLGLCVWVFL